MGDEGSSPSDTTRAIADDLPERRDPGGFRLDDAHSLLQNYESIIASPRLSWVEHHRLTRKLGEGGQGVVFLCQRVGADNFALPVALKVFSPGRYPGAEAYDAAMRRMAHVAARIALIQQDNLIDVHNLLSLDRVRVLEMEWVDGYDLYRLLTPSMLQRERDRVTPARWDYVNDVVVTAGPVQPRLKPGVAIAVVRAVLSALSSLHREGIVHGDIKPSNVMLKRTGDAKLIDIGSAFDWEREAPARSFTPVYAAPEVIEGHPATPRSDLASLGYLLVEVLAGAPPFEGARLPDDYLKAKRDFPGRLDALLPADVTRNDLLMTLIRRMVAPDPGDRFPDADAADLFEQGAADFQRQLVRSNLASEYVNEIRTWMEELD